MDRFFSKLDLRDIKIDPRGNHFPPDAAAFEEPQTTADDLDDAYMNGRTPVELTVDPVDMPVPHADEDDWDAPPSFQPLSEPVAPVARVARVARDRTNADDIGSMTESDGDILKVSARSRPSAVAGAIAGVVREAGRAEVQAIGAGATNQAVKAVAIARDYLRETGIEAVCLPAFIDITIDNEDRTAIRLVIEPR